MSYFQISGKPSLLCLPVGGGLLCLYHKETRIIHGMVFFEKMGQHLNVSPIRGGKIHVVNDDILHEITSIASIT